ncbi:MAG: hypothetical protein HRT38_19260 [Alteromonadaceae bacterium]|nr:hypothetical protein [Alteromonadaceae bacterium]
MLAYGYFFTVIFNHIGNENPPNGYEQLLARNDDEAIIYFDMSLANGEENPHLAHFMLAIAHDGNPDFSMLQRFHTIKRQLNMYPK